MTEADFIRAVCESPHDDWPRLIFADWLDERGGSGDGERATFVRVQVALATCARREVELFNEDVDWSQCTGVAASWCPNCGDCCCKDREESMNDKGCPLHAPSSRHCCLEWLHDRMDDLCRRERQLLEAHRREWVMLGLPADWCPSERHEGGSVSYGFSVGPDCDYTHVGATFRRGFVSTIRLPCDAFMRYAGALFAAAPITEVALTDREPYGRNSDGRVCWSNYTIEDEAADRSELPPPIFELLAFGERIRTGVRRGENVWYDSRDLALAAVSDACVSLGRQAAGLPLLSKGVPPCPIP